VTGLKGISEFFFSLLVLLIVISLITPVIMYFKYADISAKEAGSKIYNNTVVLANLRLELIIVGNDFNRSYLYNYGSSPAYVQVIIYNGTVYDVDKMLPPGSLVSLSDLTGTSVSINNESVVYVIANGTLIKL
jgi:hypothetical protein